MKIGILALQGAFIEHEKILEKLNVDYIELRQKKDLEEDIDGLILPGGESTVQGKLLKDLDMFDILKDKMYCRCKGKYCTGYPAIIDLTLLRNLQNIRNKFGRTNVTSLLRCKTHNKKVGGSTTSKHLKGKAVDFNGVYTWSLNKRKEVIEYWFTLLNPNYSYCNGYYKKGRRSGKRTAKGMGTSVHGDVK